MSLKSQMNSKMSTAYSGLSALIQAATSQLGDLGEETNAMEAGTETMDTTGSGGSSSSSSSRSIPTTPTLESEYYLDGNNNSNNNNNMHYAAAAA
ncbi:MAG: hypothetical protein ACI8RD_011552, partial [Bacillariaceae sp.]